MARAVLFMNDMRAVSQAPTRLVPRAPPRSRATGRRVYLAVIAAVVLAAVAAIALTLRAGPSGLRGLPAEERAALVTRTVDELRQYCGPGRAPALEDHCRELASFAARFDECRGECEALVRPLLTSAPTR